MSAASDILPSSPRHLPQVVQEIIFPDEKIIWMQRGRGWRWPLVYTGAPVLVIVVTTLLLWLVARHNPPLFAMSLIPLVIIAPLWAIRLLRPILGPQFEHYALTDLRVLHCSDLFTRSSSSLVYDQDVCADDLPITCIAVWGQRERGWIMLRSEINAPRWGRWSHPTSLVGVEHPLEIAALIKSTLNLPYEIEDHTR